MKAGDDFLRALREAVAPAHKSISLLLAGDEASPDAAQSKLSRILAGELKIPPDLIALAVQGPNPGPLHEWYARVGRVEVRPLRDPAGVLRERIHVELVRVHEQLELLLDQVREADEIEAEEAARAPMARVLPAGKRRERA